MLYQHTKWYSIRAKDDTYTEIAVELDSSQLGIDTDSITNEYPMVKDSLLVYWGDKYIKEDAVERSRDEYYNQSSLKYAAKKMVVLPYFNDKYFEIFDSNKYHDHIAQYTVFDDQFFFKFYSQDIYFLWQSSVPYQTVKIPESQDIVFIYKNYTPNLSPLGRCFAIIVKKKPSDSPDSLSMNVYEINQNAETSLFEINRKREILDFDGVYYVEEVEDNDQNGRYTCRIIKYNETAILTLIKGNHNFHHIRIYFYV